MVRPPVDAPKISRQTLAFIGKTCLQRFPKTDIRVISASGYDIKISINIGKKGNTEIGGKRACKYFLQALRQEELASLVKGSKALFPKRDGVLYLTPSKTYCKSFLRVGNIQISTVAIDACFFWLIPHLSECEAIVTETWSISSIGINAARRAEKYSYLVGKGKKIQYETISSYLDDSEESTASVRNTIVRLGKAVKGRIVFILSAVSTGRCHQRLMKLCHEMGLNSNRISTVALFSLGNPNSYSHLCDLSQATEELDFSTITSIPDLTTNEIIHIDPNTYFPIAIQDQKISVDARDGKLAKDFIEKYSGGKVFKVHADRKIYGRDHHDGIYIDVLQMLNIPCFTEKIDAIVKKILCVPRLIITRDFPGSVGLSKHIAQALGGVVGVICHSGRADGNLDDPIFGILNACTEEDEVLVVDDAAARGHQLTLYSELMRRCAYRGRIRYIIGVARPERKDEWERKIKYLTYRAPLSPLSRMPHTVDYAEFVFLPKWDASSCPWCQEAQALRSAIASRHIGENVRNIIATRMMELDLGKNSGGLFDKVFWSIERPLKLYSNSVFITHAKSSEVDVFVAVASAVQYVRQRDSGLRLETHYPYRGVLNPDDYLGDKYTDPILRCAFLRSASVTELNLFSEIDEALRVRQCHDIINEANNITKIGLEFLIASLLGKIPVTKIGASELGRQESVQFVMEYIIAEANKKNLLGKRQDLNALSESREGRIHRHALEYMKRVLNLDQNDDN